MYLKSSYFILEVFSKFHVVQDNKVWLYIYTTSTNIYLSGLFILYIELLHHNTPITGTSLLLKMLTIIIPHKNVYLPELCYPVHGFRERVYCVLDVGVHAVFLAVVVPRGPNTHSAVRIGHLVWPVVVVWLTHGTICKIKTKLSKLGNRFIFSLVYYKSKTTKNFKKHLGIYISEVVL